MRQSLSLLSLLSLLLLSLIGSQTSHASCRRVFPWIDSGCDACGMGLALGNVNITSNYLQPVGTPLGSSVVNFTSGVRYSNPDKVLYECDISDANQIYEEFATNGDDRVGGFFDLGKADGNDNYYATYFPYVGVKLTHLYSGMVFTRNWQISPITHYATVGNKIQIRVKDLSPIRADLIKISSLPGRGNSNYCGYIASNPFFGLASATQPASYSCIQPNGYVLFLGPGIAAEEPGSDSSLIRNFHTWITGRWNAMGMGTSPISSISYTATCVARSVTPLVYFPTLSAAQLMAGQTMQRQFTVDIECDNAASLTAMYSPSIGIQVPYDSYQIAKKMNLVDPAWDGVKYLLSNNYGTDSDVATGVGIQLGNGQTGQPLNFLGWRNQAGCGSTLCYQGSGWTRVLNIASQQGSTAPGYTHYLAQYTATLMHLPGQTVTPGKIHATGYVWVKIQ